MKKLSLLLFIPLLLCQTSPLNAQKKAIKSITAEELKIHMDYLASDELEGRATGEEGLLKAADYLGRMAAEMGLSEAGRETDYFQDYIIEERAYDWEASYISISSAEDTAFLNQEPFFVFPALKADGWECTGKVVFAGYGIREDNFDYNDFEGVDVKDKIVLLMNRAPMNETGTDSQFGNEWMDMQNIQLKMKYLASLGPKAVLVVMDPKSGFNSFGEMAPGLERYLSHSRSLKAEATEESEGARANEDDEAKADKEQEKLKLVMIHREVAQKLLAPYGKDLATIQQQIDTDLEPRSFELEGERLTVKLSMKSTDLTVPNVFGVIEGSDPDLKDKFVIYVAHYDHVGTDGEGGVFNGADDNASGTVALLEIAEAFLKERKRPKRSVGILWVSAEEIGLFGSRYFAEHPMVPIENIAAVINLDMVGRVVSKEDKTPERNGLTIVGRDSVKIIGGKQSSVLMELNEKTLEEMGLYGNYDYNDTSHPARYYYRSDHINFARQDIPVLFYSTGTHADYHKVTDDPEKIDYEKFLHMTRFAFKVGFNVANHSGEIVVDNPMSTW